MKKEFKINLVVTVLTLAFGGVGFLFTIMVYAEGKFVAKDTMVEIKENIEHIKKNVDNINNYLLNNKTKE